MKKKKKKKKRKKNQGFNMEPLGSIMVPLKNTNRVRDLKGINEKQKTKNKTKQNKTKQNKTKQNKTKQKQKKKKQKKRNREGVNTPIFTRNIKSKLRIIAVGGLGNRTTSLKRVAKQSKS